MNWFFVFPTKKAAMKKAKDEMDYSPDYYPKGIRYFRLGTEGAVDAAFNGALVIEQVTYYYHGA